MALTPRTGPLLLAASLLSAALASCGDGDEPPGESCSISPTQTFHERIEPLLSDQRPSTCNQCHLSGVDLTVFARETPCKTWACLVSQGLVDVTSPKDSKILAWIERASPDSALITPEVIAAEHDAFQQWIEANAACPSACGGVECGAPKAGPTCEVNGDEPPEVPPLEERGCSDREVEQSFYDLVYTWRGRCFPCHYDTELKAEPEAPRWISIVGNCETGSAASLKRALKLGIIDTASPVDSLILKKPLDVSGGGVKHGGGAKLDTADVTYQSFLRFAEYYAACQAK